jgi:hypothetical protein
LKGYTTCTHHPLEVNSCIKFEAELAEYSNYSSSFFSGQRFRQIVNGGRISKLLKIYALSLPYQLDITFQKVRNSALRRKCIPICRL